MMYLETLLRTMDSKANVMVMLSSETEYDFGFKMQDGCGNHHVRNWLEAIDNNCLDGRFVVKGVEVTLEDYMDAPQWKVTLLNVKCSNTILLSKESNEAAYRNYLN